VVPRTHAILSNIDVNIQDVKDILQTLQIGKACGDDGISHQMLKATSQTICLPLSILLMSSKILSFCSEENLLVRLHLGRIVRGHIYLIILLIYFVAIYIFAKID
jgi:hypothetical protein